jgi:hypothetical protein
MFLHEALELQASILDFGRAPSVGLKAQRLAEGYYAFLVAHLVAVNPTSINSLPPLRVGAEAPIGKIPRKDGTHHLLNLRHYLDHLRTDRDLQREFLRVWAMGSLLALGDELQKHGYFDHAPLLELVYHLRNGVAHGNQFNIDSRGLRRLAKYSANNRSAAVKRNPRGHGRHLRSNLLELRGDLQCACDHIGDDRGSVRNPNHGEVPHAAQEAIRAQWPVKTGEKLIGAGPIMGVDEADFGDAVHQRQAFASAPQPDHVPRVGRIRAGPASGLLRSGGLKALLEQRLQHFGRVDKAIGRLRTGRGISGEHRWRAVSELIHAERASERVAVLGGDGFGDRESIHLDVP